MRLKLPLLRTRYIRPAQAPILRYGVAVLSIILALIPAFLLHDVVESRLVVFGVAVMVSCLVRRVEAWFGRHLVRANRQRLLLAGGRTHASGLSQSHHTAGLIRDSWPDDLLAERRPAHGAGGIAAVGGELPVSGDQCSLRDLPLRLRRNSSRSQPRHWSRCWSTNQPGTWLDSIWRTCIPTRSSGSPGRSPALWEALR